jgi:hypothetical protein
MAQMAGMDLERNHSTAWESVMEAFWPHRSSGNGRVSTRGPLRHNFIIPEEMKSKARF